MRLSRHITSCHNVPYQRMYGATASCSFGDVTARLTAPCRVLASYRTLLDFLSESLQTVGRRSSCRLRRAPRMRYDNSPIRESAVDWQPYSCPRLPLPRSSPAAGSRVESFTVGLAAAG